MSATDYHHGVRVIEISEGTRCQYGGGRDGLYLR